jgi:hypothetical protein
LQLATMAVLLLGIELGLRVFGVERTARALGVNFLPDAGAVPRDEGAPVGARDRRWLRNASRLLRRWPLDRTCLRSALLVGWILRRRDPLLVIGVRTHEGKFEAHAWIRLGDRDLDDSATTYVAFDHFHSRSTVQS